MAVAKKPVKDESLAEWRAKFERRRAGALLVALAVILSIGFGFLGGYVATSRSANSSGPVNAPSQQKVVTSESQLINKIATTVGPSVVSVDVTTQTEQQTGFFGLSQPVTGQAAGTGIILNKGGLIITNRHVVPAGTTQVSVTLADGTTFKNVKVVGRTNTDNSLDIAFLQIQNLGSKKLTPASLGESSRVQVGDSVVAIGNALGQFQNTVTSGIISGHGRSVTASDESGSSSENLNDLFQTDAAINPGNSGGPLVNISGQVVGINTAVAGSAQNIGFAIPINDVQGLIKSVEANGKLEQPYIGVEYVPLTKDYAYVYNLPVSQGAYIAPSSQTGQQSIVPGGPAAKAGLKAKDIITKINGTKIDQSHSLISLLYQHQTGDKVTLTILRSGRAMTVQLTLGNLPSSSSSS